MLFKRGGKHRSVERRGWSFQVREQHEDGGWGEWQLEEPHEIRLDGSWAPYLLLHQGVGTCSSRQPPQKQGKILMKVVF